MTSLPVTYIAGAQVPSGIEYLRLTQVDVPKNYSSK